LSSSFGREISIRSCLLLKLSPKNRIIFFGGHLFEGDGMIQVLGDHLHVYLGGCSPAEDIQSWTCAVVSACRAFLNSSSRSLPGGKLRGLSGGLSKSF
jgi:hypothetical protein